MNREEFIGKLQMCYFGEKNAFNEVISEYDRLNNIIKDIKDYVNFLVIINQTISGKFSETQWGQDILGLIGDDSDTNGR